jgi:hypothetical protein
VKKELTSKKIGCNNLCEKFNGSAVYLQHSHSVRGAPPIIFRAYSLQPGGRLKKSET